MVQKFGDHHRLDVWNSRNNARFSISTGAGFLPSTLSFQIRPMVTRSQYQQSLIKLMLIHGKVFSTNPDWWPKVEVDSRATFVSLSVWQSCFFPVRYRQDCLESLANRHRSRHAMSRGVAATVGRKKREKKTGFFSCRRKTAKKRNRGKIHGQHFKIQLLLLGCG